MSRRHTEQVVAMVTNEIQQIVEDIEIALTPDTFMRWLCMRPNEEYTGIEYVVSEMVFASGEDDYAVDGVDFEDDDLDDYTIWDMYASNYPRNISYADDIRIDQQDEYLVLSDIDTHEVLAYITLPEWIIDLDKLSVLQRTVNQLPLLHCQVQQYLLCCWGMDADFPQQNVMEYWDY